MKKSLALILVLVLIAALCGCAAPSAAPDAPAAPAAPAAEPAEPAVPAEPEEAPAEQPAIDTSKHVVINYMTTGNIPTNQTDKMLAVFNEKLTAKINAEVSIYWIEWTNYVTNYNLVLASQDGSVDLVGTATDWLDAWPNSKNGAFLELTEDMLKTYAPMTWDSVPADHWELCKYDGKIYMMPEDNYAQWINHGFMFRQDWASEAGLTDGVHSWEQLGTYFQYIKDNKEGVIPWDAAGSGTTVYDALAGGWITSHTGNMIIDGFGVSLFYGESKDNPYKLSKYYLEGDELVNFAKTMKEWNDAGYWREDVLNYNGETREEFYTGDTGADQHHTETFYGTVRPKMDVKQPGSDVGFFYFGEESKNLVGMNITHGAMALSAASPNPERALMAYDLIRNDKELYQLFNFGIEGEQYILNDDGMFVRPEGFEDSTDGISTNYWWGRNDDLEIRNAERAWGPYEKLTTVYEQIASPYAYGKIVFDTDNISSYISNLSNVYNTYMAQIAFGKVDDAEAYVAEFREALLAAGYQECINEIESQLAAVYGA